jgi:hypothetical protein
MFEIIDDPEETISYARESIKNRPTPLGINEYENSYL